jgi:hypothetical protein
VATPSGISRSALDELISELAVFRPWPFHLRRRLEHHPEWLGMVPSHSVSFNGAPVVRQSDRKQPGLIG